MRRIFLYDNPIIPEGFKFPEEYITLAKTNPSIDLEPWKLLFNSMGTSLSYYGDMLKKYEDKPLIPFAVFVDESGIIDEGYAMLACFDVDDRSGDPIVYLHNYEKKEYPIWSKRYHIKNFTAWLKRAEKEAEEFRVERLKYED